MRRLQYRLDLGGELEHYPPTTRGRPSSATVAAYIEGSTTLFASEAVTLDAAQQAIADVGADDLVLTVADSSDFVVGRRYIVRTSGGRKRLVTVLDVRDGEVELDQVLGFDVAAGFIEGHGLRRDLTAAEAGTIRRRMRLEWTYIVGGRTYVDTVLFDVVPVPFELGLTEADIEGAASSFGERIGEGWEQLATTAERLVFDRLSDLQIEPDRCYERDRLRTAAAFLTLALVHAGDNETLPGKTPFDRWSGLFEDTMRRYEAGHFWYDRDEDQVAALGLANTSTITIDGQTYQVAPVDSGGDWGELETRARSEVDGADAYQLRTG